MDISESIGEEHLCYLKHPQFFKDYGLRDQIRRASVSIVSNIAGGIWKSNQLQSLPILLCRGSPDLSRDTAIIALDLRYISECMNSPH